MNQTQPVLFVPHGAPTFALRPGAAGAALVAKAATLALPRAIVIVSAHWDTAVPTVGLAEKLETIHDFWGFPEALYAIRYPATGCRKPRAKWSRHRGCRPAGGQRCHARPRPRRLGAAAPDVPRCRGAGHSAVRPEPGRCRTGLPPGPGPRPLAAKGFLIIGSGSITHNLGDYQAAWQNGGQTPAYVRIRRLAGRPDHRGNLPALLDYRRQAPAGAQAHPSEEHLLPFHVALGAGGENARTTRFHAGIDDYVIAMDAYAFEQGEPQ
jgi:4,5-DOPA dioxygenase extradiol